MAEWNISWLDELLGKAKGAGFIITEPIIVIKTHPQMLFAAISQKEWSHTALTTVSRISTRF